VAGLPPGSYSVLFMYGERKVKVAAEVLAGRATQIAVAIDTAGVEIVKLDGARWILEGARGGTYRVLSRHGPSDDVYRDGDRFRRVGLWFLERSGLGPTAIY
jgi:hypothetical protein